MVPPKTSKSKVVHIATYKGRRSPREKKKKRKLKLRLSRTPARKDQQGFGMLLIAEEKIIISAMDLESYNGIVVLLLTFLGVAFRYFLLLRLAPLVSPSSIFLRFEFQLFIT